MDPEEHITLAHWLRENFAVISPDGMMIELDKLAGTTGHEEHVAAALKDLQARGLAKRVPGGWIWTGQEQDKDTSDG